MGEEVYNVYDSVGPSWGDPVWGRLNPISSSLLGH